MFKKTALFFALLLVVISFWLTFSIIMTLSGINTGGSAGYFIFNTFYHLSFYVPAYLLFCSFFLLKKEFDRNDVLVLILTVVPFLTAGIALRIAIGTGKTLFEKAVYDSFGPYSPVLLFLLTVIELLFLIKLALYLKSPGAEPGADPVEADRTEQVEAEGEAAAVYDPESSDERKERYKELNLDSVSLLPGNKPYSEDNIAAGVTRPGDDTSEDINGEEASAEEAGDDPLEIDGVDLSEPAYYRHKRDVSGEIIPDSSDITYPLSSEAADEKWVEEIETLEEENADDEITGWPGSEEYAEESSKYDNPVDPDNTVEVKAEFPDEDGYVEVPESEGYNDFSEDYDELQPGKEDDTAIVREYFASARFIKPSKKPGVYEIPCEGVLDIYEEESYNDIDNRTRDEALVLKNTLAEFKIEAEVTGIRKGPVITMFEILPAPGVKLSRITNLADNIALRLAASRVRIVAPIPGKHAVGIEVPNRKRSIVSFRELIEVNYNQYSKYALPIVLGKDITGEEQIIDLTQTPHLLIAGATGSGKSVCVNSIITSILYKRPPRDVKMILIDPKIVELKLYNGIPHLLTPVITDPKKAFQALQYCVFEMERRYTLLDALGVRDIKSFNKKIKNNNIATMPLPYILVIVDEFADLMATTGKELESTLARLAAMSRAVGIHLVLATQRPSIDVITGLIKANIPSRIAFMVASKTDSRIIIDSSGAEMLLGKGDMLFTSAWNPFPVRIQGAFLSEGEVEKVTEKVKEYGEPEYIDDEIFIDDEEDDFSSFEDDYANDPLMDKALEIVTTAGKASASYLQRRLKIGYNRAARLVEEMERKGIVGPQNGSKPRDLLHIPDSFKE